MSTLEARTIEPQSGTTVTLGASGDSVVIGADALKTNTIKDAGGNTIFTSDGAGTLSSINSGLTGNMIFISSQTVTGTPTTIEFTSGIDSTYDEYVFYYINMHPVTGGGDHFEVNFSTDGGSNYNVTKTTTFFWAYHTEADASALEYKAGYDLAQSTSYQYLGSSNSSDADGGCSGILHLFSPSSTTYVKHFYARTQTYTEYPADGAKDDYAAGYCNTTSAINAVSFKHNAGNTDAGTIYLYGIK